MAIHNHITPSYYKSNEHECIEEIRAMLTPEEFKGFIKGNILKYRYRQNYKGDQKRISVRQMTTWIY